MINAGQLTVAKDAIYKWTTLVLSAVRNLKPLIIYSLPVFFREKFGLESSSDSWSDHVPPAACTAFADWWTSAHKRIAKPDRKSFDSLVILAAWCLWKERNRRTFDHQTRSTADLFSLISDDVVSWCQAGHQQLVPVASAFGRSLGRQNIQM